MDCIWLWSPNVFRLAGRPHTHWAHLIYLMCETWYRYLQDWMNLWKCNNAFSSIFGLALSWCIFRGRLVLLCWLHEYKNGRRNMNNTHLALSLSTDCSPCWDNWQSQAPHSRSFFICPYINRERKPRPPWTNFTHEHSVICWAPHSRPCCRRPKD